MPNKIRQMPSKIFNFSSYPCYVKSFFHATDIFFLPFLLLFKEDDTYDGIHSLLFRPGGAENDLG